VVKTVTTAENNPVTSETETDETSDWKTYENKEIGFSIKYPKEWQSIDTSASYPDKNLFLRFLTSEDAKNQYKTAVQNNDEWHSSTYFFVEDNPNNESLENFTDNNYLSKETFNQNNLSILHTRGMVYDVDYYNSYYWIKNRKLFNLVTDDKNVEFIKDIINTFKFE
jgi:hypothetical protein